MTKKYNVIIPTIEKDMYKIIDSIDLVKKFIDYKKIVFIGDSKVKEKVDSLKLKDVVYFDENKLYKNMNIKYISNIFINKIGDRKRAGWYFQQFLKMAYATICDDEYYMSWDSDTIPLKKISMFSTSGKPYFDLKTEYHKPYFDTMSILFGKEFQKVNDKSFISEHMLFKVSFMKELIEELEKDGDLFFEKILNSIDKENLSRSGFSEFETFGTWVSIRYPEFYELRDWYSLRQGSTFYSFPLEEKDIIKLSKYYDAISFEKEVTRKKKRPHNGIIPLSIYLNILIKKSAIIKEVRRRLK